MLSLLRFLVWLVLILPAAVVAGEECGPVRARMWDKYPVDYRESLSNFNVGQLVNVAELTKGFNTEKGLGDILLYVPNHPRALKAMERVAEKEKGRRTVLGGYTMDCWYDRAIRWVPDDSLMRRMYGIYLSKEKRYQDALAQFLELEKRGDDTSAVKYNIGLMYLEVGNLDEALRYAREVYSRGFNLPVLKERLQQAGKWSNPSSGAETGKRAPQADAGEASASAVKWAAGAEDSLGAHLPPPPMGEDCGQSLEASHDPTEEKSKGYLRSVENRHFTYDVEHLVGGNTGKLPGDITYLLERFPNHARGLVAMMNYLERYQFRKVPGSLYSMRCWLDRAVRWRPNDSAVRTILAGYFLKVNKFKEAANQFELVVRFGNGSPENIYNVGLAYYRLGDYDKALEWAHRAYAAGAQVAGLRQMLEKVGKWREPQPPADAQPVASSAGQGVGGATALPSPEANTVTPAAAGGQ